MADYTYSELMKMQSDAINRVEDMQKRVRAAAGIGETNNNNRMNNAEAPRQKAGQSAAKRVMMPDDYLNELKKYAASSSHYDNDREGKHGESRKKSGEEASPVQGLADKLSSFVSEMNIDSDKALILSLIMLLSEEKADESLILALLYMLT